MNIDLLEASIKHHGKHLYDLIVKENDLQSSQNSIIYTDANIGEEKQLAYQTNSDLSL